VDLNRQANTGGLMGRPVIPLTKAIPGSPMWGDLISGLTGNSAWPQMKSINSALAPAQRIPGSGASSDLDVKMFRESLPNVETPGPANELTAQRLQQQSDKDAAYAAFQDTWYAKNGTLLGADKAFNQFWLARLAGDPVANRTGLVSPIQRAQRAISAANKATKPRATILAVEPD
jgi:hypothetical protein